MKIAVACDGMGVSSHAARCESLMCYTTSKGIITDCRNLPNMGISGAEVIALLKATGSDAFITGGIDIDMANELCRCGIEVVAGVKGTARQVVEDYINHTLMGAIELCHASSEEHDPEDQDVEDAFERMALSMGL